MKLIGAQTPMAVSVSISESLDMAMLGLMDEHLKAIMHRIATHMLANGVSLAYGGDLRPSSFTDFLSEMLFRYRGGADGECTITNYLAWPVHINMKMDEISEMSKLGHIQMRLMDLNGGDISVEDRYGMPMYKPNDGELAKGLTAMRRTMCAETDARIVLGGRVDGYGGRMPDICEEVLLSLESRKPVFLVGGFGGCTRDMAETLGLIDAWAGSRPAWPGRDELKNYGAEDLRNGLTLEENRTLAGSRYMDEIVVSILIGIYRLCGGRTRNGR